MKTLLFLLTLAISATAIAQTTKLPHGTNFGEKTSSQPLAYATKLAAYMGTRIRVNTTIEGKIIRVTKSKGGWFEMDGGNGQIIAAHFASYNITLPKALAGHNVIITGVAEKQINADSQQHFAGDSAASKQKKTSSTAKITFEVAGLTVDK